jgi:DNA-binding transcriptional ArsR family regulator
VGVDHPESSLVQRRRGAIKEEESRQAEYDAKRRNENRRGFLTWRLGDLAAHLSPFAPTHEDYSSHGLTITEGVTIVKPMLNNAAVDRVFHALGEPVRRALVERLSAGPTSVSDLAQPFDLTLAAIVQHLQILEESGVVRSEKVGRVRTCRLAPDGLRVAERWISERRALWERRFDRLGHLLEEEDRPLESRTQKASKANKRKKP